MYNSLPVALTFSIKKKKISKKKKFTKPVSVFNSSWGFCEDRWLNLARWAGLFYNETA